METLTWKDNISSEPSKRMFPVNKIIRHCVVLTSDLLLITEQSVSIFLVRVNSSVQKFEIGTLHPSYFLYSIDRIFHSKHMQCILHNCYILPQFIIVSIQYSSVFLLFYFFHIYIFYLFVLFWQNCDTWRESMVTIQRNLCINIYPLFYRAIDNSPTMWERCHAYTLSIRKTLVL